MKINENKFDWFFLFNTLKGFFIEHIETVFLNCTERNFFVHGSILFRKSETNNVN